LSYYKVICSYFIKNLKDFIIMSEAVRNYSMTDAELMMFASNLVQTITNDLAQFAQFGVDADTVQEFKDLGDDFEVFPPDQFYLTDIGVFTEEKEAIRKQLILETRKITNRGLTKWGEDAMKYKKFGVAGITTMTDKTLLATSRLVVLAAEKYLTELASEGLTQPIIDTYKALSETFEQKMNDMSDAIEIRDNKKKERIILGNQLYALVTKYCTYGKSIWADVDESKFNNYIIYSSVSPGSLTAPQNLRYETDYMKVVWDAVENATSYQLEVSTDGVNFTELTTTTDPEFGFIPYDAHTYYKCRARNSGGYGGYSTVMDFWYYDPLPAPQNFQAEIIPGHECRLSWEMVHSATTYRVYISDVAFGEPEGPFIPFLNTGQLEYTTTLTPGRRMYFKVTCFNPYQAESAFSNTSYVEVTGGTP
jgi:hypothetical protein